MTTTAILLAGGSGTRLGTGANKVYLELGDHPMVGWSLDAFERCPLIDDVVLVTRPVDHRLAREVADALGITKLRTIVDGGATRHGSEQAGLDAIAPSITDGTVTLVAIHDAARPFVSQDLLARILTAAATHGGSVPALHVEHPFLVRAPGHGAESGSRATAVDVRELRRVQTPQAFHARELLAAYRAATAAGFHGVDTAETVEHHGELTTVTVEGDVANAKVTFVDDLREATARAQAWPEAPGRR